MAQARTLIYLGPMQGTYREKQNRVWNNYNFLEVEVAQAIGALGLRPKRRTETRVGSESEEEA